MSLINIHHGYGLREIFSKLNPSTSTPTRPEGEWPIWWPMPNIRTIRTNRTSPAACKSTMTFAGNNYGARLDAFFTPPAAGAYEFFVYNDDAAQVWLSTDATEANLQLLVDSPNIQAAFDSSVMGVSSPLVAGQKYLLRVLYRQNTGSALLGVAARMQGDATPMPTGRCMSPRCSPRATAAKPIRWSSAPRMEP